MDDETPPPEENPFACSRCGTYLFESKRISADDYCDACLREMGVRTR